MGTSFPYQGLMGGSETRRHDALYRPAVWQLGRSHAPAPSLLDRSPRAHTTDLCLFTTDLCLLTA